MPSKRNLTQQEIAAMWLYHTEYELQEIGIALFYSRLSQHEKNRIDEMIKQIVEAAPALSLPAKESEMDAP